MKKAEKKMYKLTVSENQARIIMDALESYFRCRMGQFFDLADAIAFKGYDHDKDTDSSEFYHRINYRNDAEDLFNQAYRLASSGDLFHYKTQDERNAIDIWHVIRHQFWKENPNSRDDTTDSYPPFPTCDEELIKIGRIDE